MNQIGILLGLVLISAISLVPYSFAQTGDESFSSLFEFLKSLFSSGKSSVISDSIPNFDSAAVVLTSSTTSDKPKNDNFANGLVKVSSKSSEDKVILCHVPPGNPDKSHTISLGSSAVAAHLAHGDYLGTCVDQTVNQNTSVNSNISENGKGNSENEKSNSGKGNSDNSGKGNSENGKGNSNKNN